MTDRNVLLAGALIIAAGVGHWWWRRQRAREIAERWLTRHHYRVRSLRFVYFSLAPRFRATPFRNNDWAVDLRAEVDDLRLGGTGEVRLRVWTDWLGMIDREPEVSWDRMPVEREGSAPAPAAQWAESQLALLRRVADGESSLRPASRERAARAEFDETVEHVLALQRRGLVTCATPIAELKGDAQYAAISNIALTDGGRRVLDRAAVSGETAQAN